MQNNAAPRCSACSSLTSLKIDILEGIQRKLTPVLQPPGLNHAKGRVLFFFLPVVTIWSPAFQTPLSCYNCTILPWAVNR